MDVVWQNDTHCILLKCTDCKKEILSIAVAHKPTRIN
jgi:hypothetical protein